MIVHFSSETDDWATPQALFDELNKVYQFTLDPSVSEKNAKCKKFYTAQDDGLQKDWSDERVFLNPPYGREIGKWIEKAATGGADIVVALLPARTDTKWFHQFIYKKAEVKFLRGRLKFGDSKNSAPFPSMIVIFTN